MSAWLALSADLSGSKSRLHPRECLRVAMGDGDALRLLGDIKRPVGLGQCDLRAQDFLALNDAALGRASPPSTDKDLVERFLDTNQSATVKDLPASVKRSPQPPVA
jgi:hypothetical protein